MRPSAFTTFLIVVAGLSAPAFAQQRPDFSGTWKASADAPPGLTAAPNPVLGERFSIRQADTIALLRPLRDTATLATFPSAGGEARVHVPGPLCQADIEVVEKIGWDGDALVHTITGVVPAGGGALSPRNVRRVLRMTSADTLVVEGTAMQEGQPRPAATVYKRSTETMPAPAERAKGPAATIAQMGWLGGTWIGTAGQSTIEERWTPSSGGSALAISRTLRNNVMSAFEFLCIVERGGTLVYTAMPNGRMPPTDFTLTSITADAATFENPAHDFPKMIRYTRRADGALEAMIAGAKGERPQTFTLKKQE
jgi:hypothetical protein